VYLLEVEAPLVSHHKASCTRWVAGPHWEVLLALAGARRQQDVMRRVVPAVQQEELQYQFGAWESGQHALRIAAPEDAVPAAAG
jgi:hypothetical protein